MSAPIKGFIELRTLDQFDIDNYLDLTCARCEKVVASFDDEGHGLSLRFLAVHAAEHLAECPATLQRPNGDAP